MHPTHLDSPSPPTIGPQPREGNEPKQAPSLPVTATVCGPVQYRLGDGPTLTLPLGPVELDRGPGDVTISWQTGPNSQAAAMPSVDFARFVAEGAIVLDAVSTGTAVTEDDAAADAGSPPAP